MTMKPRIPFLSLIGAVLCAGLLLGTAAQARALSDEQAQAARATVVTLGEDLAALAVRADDLTGPARIREVTDVIAESFDLKRIAAATVGHSRFDSWSDAQQADYIDAFIGYTIATQQKQLMRYERDRLSIIGISEAENGLVRVRTNYAGTDGKASTVDFFLAKDKTGDYRVIDLVIDGSISQLALRKAEFSSVLQNKGYDGLIDILRRKTEQLIARGG